MSCRPWPRRPGSTLRTWLCRDAVVVVLLLAVAVAGRKDGAYEEGGDPAFGCGFVNTRAELAACDPEARRVPIRAGGRAEGTVDRFQVVCAWTAV